MSTPAPTISTLRCRGCEYDLAGRSDGACPECGVDVASSIAQAEWWTPTRLEQLRAGLGLTAIALLWPFGVVLLTLTLGMLGLMSDSTAQMIGCVAIVVLCALWMGALALCVRATSSGGSLAPALAALDLVSMGISGLVIIVSFLATPSGSSWRAIIALAILTFAVSHAAAVAWCGGFTILALGAHRPSRVYARAALLILVPVVGLVWISAIVHVIDAEFWHGINAREEFLIVHLYGGLALAAVTSLVLAVIILRLMRFIPRKAATGPAVSPESSTEAA